MKAALRARSFSIAAKIGSGSIDAIATAGTANAGNAAALATMERRDRLDIAFSFSV
jgi:hypothetical protein